MLGFILAATDWSNLSNIDLWSLIVGTFVPLVTAIVNQPTFSKVVRVGIAVAASVVAAAVQIYLQDGFNGHNWIRAAFLVALTAQVTYRGIWKPTNIAQSIENATRFGTAKGIKREKVARRPKRTTSSG